MISQQTGCQSEGAGIPPITRFGLGPSAFFHTWFVPWALRVQIQYTVCLSYNDKGGAARKWAAPPSFYKTGVIQRTFKSL
jgi:hypothetical protein